jgi:pimeloyl-ACP methyl ester carboxylesterase
MGSAAVLALALENPERVSALGLIGAGARLRVHPDIFAYLENEATFQKGIDAIVQASFSPQTPPELVALAASRMGETRPGVLQGDFQACDLFDVMEGVSKIRQPSIILCGAEDRMTPVRYSQYLNAQIPNSRLEIVPEAGHMVMLEKPRLVADVLKDFFDEVL